MISTSSPKVLYDVPPHEFCVPDDNHRYQMNSKIDSGLSSTSKCQSYWSTVAESSLIAQQVSL